MAGSFWRGEVPVRVVAGVLFSALVVLLLTLFFQALRGRPIDDTVALAVVAIAFSTAALRLGPTGDQLGELNATAQEIRELIRHGLSRPGRALQAPEESQRRKRMAGLVGCAVLLGLLLGRHRRRPE